MKDHLNLVFVFIQLFMLANACSPDPAPPPEPKPEPTPDPLKVCGRSQFPLEFGQTASGKAEPGWFPWTVGVLVHRANGATILCGGALVHLSIILVPAHCVVPNPSETS